MPQSIHLNGSGVLIFMGAVIKYYQKIIIKTEKHTVAFENTVGNNFDFGIVSHNNIKARATTRSSGGDIISGSFSSTSYNYKANPNLIINYDDSIFYCNPPIAFNEFIDISTTDTLSGNYGFNVMILYKPK